MPELKNEIENWLKGKKEEIRLQIAKKKGKVLGIKERKQEEEYSEVNEEKDDDDIGLIQKY